ncbi:MAG: class I SAM-dependent methyltransferase [Parcubacteria group bacterium]|nr:class I SAM-dependent methyltransferase [Parcubacteria group bacterium]
MTSGGFLNPDSIISNLKIAPASKAADFGSGSGYFTLLLAKAVGPDGVVTAVDVLKEKLETVKSAAQAQGLLNINYVRANLEMPASSGLDEASQDMVILANILFQSQKKEDIIKEAHRVLKASGDLAVIDWEVASAFGPKEAGWKISKEEARNLITGLGFTLVKEIEVASNHWGMVFKKN